MLLVKEIFYASCKAGEVITESQGWVMGLYGL